MKSNLPKRKSPRLKGYDYSGIGAYFITICTHNHECILSRISVGTDVLDCPQNQLSLYGKIADKYIGQMSDFYDNILVDKYVIMPNHIHMIIRVTDNGQSGTPVPTNERTVRANALISRFVGTFKRFCNKEYGKNIWQARYNDHIIRDDRDYSNIWKYIDQNVLRWQKDCFYAEENG